MVWALICLLLLVSPTVALAEDDESVEVVPIVDNTEVRDELIRLDTDLVTRLDAISQKLDESSVQEQDTNGSMELDTLISIDEHLTQLVGETTSAGIVAQESLRAAGSVTFTAYTNVSPTGQWATYAASYLPKLDWGEHYVYLQDTSSSYVLVHGDITQNNGEFSGTGEWVRWYYAGSTNGYRVDSGSGNVGIYANGFTVLTDFAGYPILGDGTDGFRREVMYYAVVALVIFCLVHVWCFTLRTAQSLKGTS